MAKYGISHNDYLLASSSSSDQEGIREENRVSVGNLKSSSTLNDNGISLQSIPFESEILTLKSPWSIQTFVHDNLLCSRSKARKLKVYTFCYQIPSKPPPRNLSQSVFYTEIIPKTKLKLSCSNTIFYQISGQRKGFVSSGVQTVKIFPNLNIQNLHSETIEQNFKFTVSNFFNEIPSISPRTPHSPMSINLRKLKTQLISLQTVFKNVSIAEIDKNALNNEKSSIILRKNNTLLTRILKNSDTQTTPQDFSTENKIDSSYSSTWEKLESLNLDCEFIGACGYMIKKYPFYYEFIDKCYTEPHFDTSGKFEILKPKEETFKKAVIYASGCDKKYLAAINSVLQDIFKKKRN